MTSSEILTFMRLAWALLRNGADTHWLKQDRKGADYDRVSTDYYGTAAVGFTVRVGTQERAAYQQAVAASPNPGGSWGFSGMDFTAAASGALERLKG
jgi:hypothetical protein